MPYHPGRPLLQIPGPTNVPERVRRAIAKPTIDHRGAEFAAFARGLLDDLPAVFGTRQPVMVYPSSGTGAWEAALVNTLSPGDRVLGFETGHFATLWAQMCRNLGLDVVLLPGDWRHGVAAAAVEAELAADSAHRIAAVMVVHNETSTGVTSQVQPVRAALDRTGHPGLLLVDTISSLGSIDYRHDEWGVDVTVAGSQKGLMLPPGLGFNAVSDKAVRASGDAGLRSSYWSWDAMLAANESGFFPYTPSTNLLFGLRESLDMLAEEGLVAVFARHSRHAEATRAAVAAWGLETVCANPDEHSSALTAVLLPEGHDERRLREAVLERSAMPLGSGLGRLRGRAFRIGHLGDFDDLSLVATIAGVETGLVDAAVPHRPGGVQAAVDALSGLADAEPPLVATIEEAHR
ncbi:MAG TPA: aminotransferase class V-fold PLP-dependent enzyme [Nocardioidaceae bacterium]|nr:aminotransferase class V-fold PLP-dependent enzyme [Nocardioidaceae bacterium]